MHDFQLNSYIIAKTTVQGPSLRVGVGFYELRFSVRLDIISGLPMNCRVEVPIARIELVAKNSGARSLGNVSFRKPLRFKVGETYPVQEHVDLTVPLSSAQINTIEDIRAGGDLDFRVTLVGHAVGDEHPVLIENSFDVRTPRSDWIYRLQSAGVLDIIMLEVSLPFAEASDAMKSAVKHLRKAQEQLYLGAYASAVGTCRLAIEAAGLHMYGDDKWAQKTLDSLKGAGAPKVKEGREKALFSMIRHYTHPPHHDESDGGYENFTRYDAKMVIGLTTAAVQQLFQPRSEG